MFNSQLVDILVSYLFSLVFDFQPMCMKKHLLEEVNSLNKYQLFLLRDYSLCGCAKLFKKKIKLTLNLNVLKKNNNKVMVT
jgi:hypothetical protein